MKKEKWIQGAIKNPGALRKDLKAEKGKKIPEKKLNAAEKGAYGPKDKKRAVLAKVLQKMKKK